MVSCSARLLRIRAESCLVQSPILQFSIAAVQALAAVYASYIHDKVYLLLFIGVPLYVACGVIGLHTIRGRKVSWSLADPNLPASFRVAILMNFVLLGSDVLVMAYLTAWQSFYETNQLLFALTTGFLSVSLFSQILMIYLILKVAARIKGENGLVSFMKRSATERRSTRDLRRTVLSPFPPEVIAHRRLRSEVPLFPTSSKRNPNQPLESALQAQSNDLERAHSAPSSIPSPDLTQL